MSRVPSPRTTRAVFIAIGVFLLAQVVWWIVFQGGYLRSSTDERIAAWERDAAAATELLLRSGGDETLARELLATYPHLERGGDGFAVGTAARSRFLDQQAGFQRMVILEGVVFFVVILSLLAYIGASLNAERGLKRRQQNFLSAVTHEFKTPISTLRLLVQTARMRDLNEDKRKTYLEKMERELDRLERTSDQVLASARLEHAVKPPHLVTADLGIAVQTILERSRGGLEARGAVIDVHVPREGLPVRLDEPAFTLVLDNLLDNAVKYSPAVRKPVRVTVETRSDVLAVHVDDEGVGLPDEERNAVFGRFYRRGDEMTRQSPGMGLGLHLVRTTIEAMNGWVRIEDNPSGRGTRVSVLLPRRVDPATEHEALGLT